MKKTKVLITVICLLFLISGCGKSDETDADPGEIPEIVTESIQSGNPLDVMNYDVAIVMDESGSMTSSDPERVAVEAAKMFIDMEKASGISTAIVEFSDDVKNSGMILSENQDSKEYLKNILDSIVYKRAHTDTGAGLKEAVRTLRNSNTENKKVIIMFTDGRTEITSGSRTLEASKADVEEAVEMAAAEGYRIYAVGLNADGNVDEQELNSISQSTGGRTLIANDVNELPAFFNEIFKELGNIDEIPIVEFVANGEYQNVKVPIANDTILEANIVMLSGMQIEDVKLYDPSGEEVALNGDRFIFSTSEKYSMVKMLLPQKGDWNLAVKGISGDKIKINLLYNYNINMIVHFSAAQMRTGDSIVVSAYLTNEGNPVQDEAFYAGMEGKISVLCDKTGQLQEFPMTVQGNQLSGELTLDVISTYQAAVRMEGQGMYRDSEPVTIEVINQPVRQLKGLEMIKAKPGDAGSIDLKEYFEDPDGDVIGYSVKEMNPDGIKAEIHDDVLMWEAVEKNQASIFVTADDGNGGAMEAEIVYDVDTFIGRYFPFIMAAAIAIAVALLAMVLRRMSMHATGFMIIGVEERKAAEYGGIAASTFSQAQGISVSSVGRSFSLAKLLDYFVLSYNMIVFDESKKQELSTLMTKINGMAKDVRFSSTSDSQRMKVVVRGKAAFSDAAGNAFMGVRNKEISCREMNETIFYIRLKTGSDESESVIVRIAYKYMAV